MNSTTLKGRVKRDAYSGQDKSGSDVLDFAVEVWNDENGRFDIFDCRTTSASEAMNQCEGFVECGEEVTVTGHLIKQTRTIDGYVHTAKGRLQGYDVAVDSTVMIKTSATVVYVDEIEFEQDRKEENDG